MINQLFRRRPNDDELQQILDCFNLNDLNDNKSISYTEMDYYNTIDKVYDLLHLLMDLYLPCKWYYIDNLDNRKCITILRQICKLFHKQLEQSFVVIDKVKIISYKIKQNQNKLINIKKDVKISFN